MRSAMNDGRGGSLFMGEQVLEGAEPTGGIDG
jgi:hypothetical protein